MPDRFVKEEDHQRLERRVKKVQATNVRLASNRNGRLAKARVDAERDLRAKVEAEFTRVREGEAGTEATLLLPDDRQVTLRFLDSGEDKGAVAIEAGPTGRSPRLKLVLDYKRGRKTPKIKRCREG